MSTATAVRERPILFSAPMVRAIIEGRKTQTRRVLKPQPSRRVTRFQCVGVEVATQRTVWESCDESGPVYAFPDGPHSLKAEIECPYGAQDRRLWVRETFAVWGEFRDGTGYCYRADGDLGGVRWRPSIHMPRRASRITLEIARVRVERLQAITEADAAAEGTDPQRWVDFAHPLKPTRNMGGGWMPCTHVEAYQHLWDSINAGRGYSWESNPWVWVIEFRRIEQP